MTQLKSELMRLFGMSSGVLTYEHGRAMLDHPDTRVRTRLAERDDLGAEMLFFLAGDPDPDVRLAVANNPAAPGKCWLVLADDQNEEIRASLAQRLPTLLSGKAGADSDRAARTLVTALRMLVRDELPRVRERLAQALAELPDAPADVIKLLATDPIEAIAVPVARLSPILTDADLLNIISTSPLSGVRCAISQRAGVSHAVSDAVVRTGDPKAIEALLRNSSAQIREATLDLIVDLASRHVNWHDPLVRRPGIRKSVVEKVVHFIADELLDVLAARADLDPSTLSYVRECALLRLKQPPALAPIDDVFSIATSESALRLGQFRAESLRLAGRLTPETIMDTLARGPSALVIAMLALRAGMPVQSVAMAVQCHMARALVAICWAADLSAEEAVTVQSKLGRVIPSDLIRPTAAGFFAASESDLHHQLDALKHQGVAAE